MNKTYKIKCTECGKEAFKKSPQAKRCSNACNQRAYEKRKGIKAPKFIDKTKSRRSTIAHQVPAQIQNSINEVIAPQESEAQKLERRKYNLLNEFSRVADQYDQKTRQAKLFSGIAGFAFGFSSVKDDDTSMNTIFKLIGIPYLFSMAGKELFAPPHKKDNPKHQMRLDAIKREINSINDRLSQIELTKIQAKNLLDKYKTVTDKSSTVVNAQEYRKLIIPELKFNKEYSYLFGNPSENFYSLITGAPGNGKSTFCVQFSEYFQKEHGNVLYLASEQSGENKPLQGLLRKYKATFDIEMQPNKLNEKKLIGIIKDYNLVVIDSANNMDLHSDQLNNLRENAPNTAFLVVLQTTKEGTFKGDQTLKHDCDIFLKAKDMICYQTKSRFAPPSHIHIKT